MYVVDVNGAEIIDETVGSNSDDNSASVKHKEVASYAFILLGGASYLIDYCWLCTHIVETTCKEEFY